MNIGDKVILKSGLGGVKVVVRISPCGEWFTYTSLDKVKDHDDAWAQLEYYEKVEEDA